jgi:hypothetical protein
MRNWTDGLPLRGGSTCPCGHSTCRSYFADGDITVKQLVPLGTQLWFEVPEALLAEGEIF